MLNVLKIHAGRDINQCIYSISSHLIIKRNRFSHFLTIIIGKKWKLVSTVFPVLGFYHHPEYGKSGEEVQKYDSSAKIFSEFI